MTLALPRPAAVIFDMDGLLLDSERVALSLLAEAADTLGLPWRAEVGLSIVGLNSRDSDALLQATYGDGYPVAVLRERFGELYEAAIAAGRIHPKPFVCELLTQLAILRIPCAVATSTRRSRAEAKLDRAGLLPHFGALACGDEVARGKPAPEIFELAAQRLGAAPMQCLALEDSNAGVRGALAAGMTVVMVPDMLTPDDDLCQRVPIVDSLAAVLAAIRT